MNELTRTPIGKLLAGKRKPCSRTGKRNVEQRWRSSRQTTRDLFGSGKFTGDTAGVVDDIMAMVTTAVTAHKHGRRQGLAP